jgi:signal transduction histidine kinase
MKLLRRYWLEAAWVAFALGNIGVMFALTAWETVPFHFVWISLSLLYAYRVWPLRVTLPVLAVVCGITAVALGWDVIGEPQGIDELTEVPLMAVVFLVMVMHALQRQSALNATRLAAQREREFVRDASHALRTPITIALLHAELIEAAQTVAPPPDQDGREGTDIEIVVDELERLAVIASRILVLQNAGTGSLLRRGEVDVDRLVEGAARRWAGTSQRQWWTSVSAHGTLSGDEEQLGFALDALIENALHATGVGDQISITARRHGEEIVIAVSDNGKGLTEENQERAFDRFWRGDPSYRGSGLGLAMVKAVAEAHGGRVEVDSEPGRGARFSIRIPDLVTKPVDHFEVLPPAVAQSSAALFHRRPAA